MLLSSAALSASLWFCYSREQPLFKGLIMKQYEINSYYAKFYHTDKLYIIYKAHKHIENNYFSIYLFSTIKA